MRSRNRRKALETQWKADAPGEPPRPEDLTKKKVPQVGAFLASRMRHDRESTAPPLREDDSRITTSLLGEPPGPDDSRRRRSPRKRD